MKELDEDSIELKKENQSEEKQEETNKKDSIELINENSSKLIVNKNNEKIDSFEIISKEKELGGDDNSFTDLSFKLVYENDPLLKYPISKITEYLDKNSKNSDKKIIECLSNFINYDEFSEEVVNQILHNGIPETLPCLRPLIWKSLIGFYPLKELSKWKDESINKNKAYKIIIQKYNYYPNDIKEEMNINLIDQINKDLKRTRFGEPFFAEKNKKNEKENNYDVLRRILFFYANEHPDISYVQGMNEIIALIYYIFSKDDNPFCQDFIESDTYFTFQKLMEQIKKIFLMDSDNYSDLFVTSQIQEIKNILKKVEPDLIKHFEKEKLELDNVVMRWILVMFAQEFTIDIAVNFWDRLFTQKNKMKFICYISAAIIKNNKDKIMEMDSGDIMEWAQELQNKMEEIDINNIVKVSLEIQKIYKRKESNSILDK